MKKFPVSISPAEIRRQPNQTDPYSRSAIDNIYKTATPRG